MQMQNYPNMSPKIRDLYQRIWDGYSPHGFITAQLHYLDVFFPREKLEEALRYMIRNGIKAQKFVDWFQETCSASQLEMIRELTKQVERERYARRLFAKDLRRT